VLRAEKIPLDIARRFNPLAHRSDSQSIESSQPTRNRCGSSLYLLRTGIVRAARSVGGSGLV
jgi:hypothetical protein